MLRPVILALLSLVIVARAADTDPPPPLKAETVKKWGGAQTLVIARLTDARHLRSTLSEPPIHTSSLNFKVNESLRGALKKGDAVKAFHSVRQKDVPKFPVGKDCIIALVKTRNGLEARAVEPLTDAELKQVKQAMALPVGWTIDGKKLPSPWAGLKTDKKVEWDAKGLPKCDFTGRPAFLVGPGVSFQVEAVPPKVVVKYANPDGDGEYKVTVKNTTDKAITIPALRADGKNVLWKESLVIVCQDKAYPIPGAKGITTETKPVTLKAGESISTVINVLALKGPEWPRGGYRIEFQIALGEQSEVMSFYYLSRHHDPIREKAGGK